MSGNTEQRAITQIINSIFITNLSARTTIASVECMKWYAQCAKPNSIISGNVRDFKYTEKYVGRSDVDVVP